MGSDQFCSFETFLLIILFFVIFVQQSSNAILLSKGSPQSSLNGCKLFQGSWSYDEKYPLYNSSSCPFIDTPFDCQGNGRPDQLYLKYKWKPSACKLPEFNAQNFLRMLRGKTILFVGDSLSLNQWQSLTCMLHSALPQSKFDLYKKGNLSTFTFQDYDVSLMLQRNAFLVDLVVENNKRILKLDSIRNGDAWRGYDMLIFNTWHWWLHKGRLRSWDYFEDGNKLYKDMDRVVAFGKGLKTWSKWVDSNLDPSKTQVFFQGLSPAHYDGKEWDDPIPTSSCIGQTQRINGSTYPGEAPPAVAVVKKVLAEMSKPVTLLDVTMLSQQRKDGHPSIYGDHDPHHDHDQHQRKGKDCSHWCLPGVPDTWNLQLYAILVRNGQLTR